MDVEIERILQSAGIDSSPVDPSSMDALVQLVRERQKSSNINININGAVGSSAAAARAASGNGSDKDNSPFAPITTSVPRNPEHAPSDQTQSQMQTQILDLLHMHTSLMVETQRKLDAMAAKVEALERKIGDNSEKNTDMDAYVKPGRSFVAATRTRTYRERDGPPPERQVHEANHEMHHHDLHAHAGEAVRPNHVHARDNIAHPLQFAFHAVSSLTLVRIVKLFWTRSQGFVRPIDGALMFKLVFMLVVMTARVSRNPSHASGNRFYYAIFVVIAGFLYHTKYLQFMYRFFWKENIPLRVWSGEDVENESTPTTQNNVAEAAVPQPGNRALLGRRNDARRNNQAPVENGNDDEADHNFLAGAIRGWIAPRNRDENAFIGALRDIFYLFGSFFFSIFPMWQPAGPPPEAEPQHQPHEQVANDERGTGGPEPQARQQDLPDIPPVAAPPDVMTPVEDSDDDDS